MSPALRGIHAALARMASPKRLAGLAALPVLVTAVHFATVHPGDSLSKIAARDCGTAADWTGIYAANRHVIGGNPNLIEAGQHLRISCRSVPSLAALAAPLAPPQRPAGTGTVLVARAPLGTSFNVSSGYQQCVIARESGGNAQIWNASGHYGLYQFSYDTWVKAGGAPGDFGHASAGEQTQVFWSAYRMWGTQPWSPSDGC